MGDETTMSFAEKVGKLMEHMAYFQKDKKNDFHGYKYISEAAVKQRFNEGLRMLGLYASAVHIDAIPGATPQSCVARAMVSISDGDDNSCIWTGLGAGTDKGDKAPMKANAAALKYALTGGTFSATGDDPEADRSTDDPDVLRAQLEVAQTADELGALKSRVHAYRNEPVFQDLKAAYKAKAEELKNAG